MLHCNSASQDNGTVYSDSDYLSSDIVLRTNDGLRIDLVKTAMVKMRTLKSLIETIRSSLASMKVGH